MDRLKARLGRESGNFIGICLAVLATVFLMGIGAIGKELGKSIDPFQITFIRSVLMMVIFLPIFMRVGFARIKPTRPGLQMFNGLIFTVAVLGWFWALPRVPLDLVASIGFTSQLWAILGAILFMGEKPHARRWAALVIGLIGALIILRPGFAPLTPAIIVIASGTVLWAANRLIGKSVATQDNPETWVVWQAVWVSVFALIPAVWVWQTPTFEQWLWLLGLSGLTILNHFTSAWALRLADLGAIEPISYLRLLWAAMLGFVFFGDIPNIFTIIGGAMVLSSVIYIARRERQLGKQSQAVSEN